MTPLDVPPLVIEPRHQLLIVEVRERPSGHHDARASQSRGGDQDRGASDQDAVPGARSECRAAQKVPNGSRCSPNADANRYNGGDQHKTWRNRSRMPDLMTVEPEAGGHQRDHCIPAPMRDESEELARPQEENDEERDEHRRKSAQRQGAEPDGSGDGGRDSVERHAVRYDDGSAYHRGQQNGHQLGFRLSATSLASR